MSDIVKIIKGLHGIQHDILRVITVSKTVHELIPRYDPVIREKIRVLKTEISDKAILIILDYMEHLLDNETKSGFCGMANLIESMINVYLESDKPVETEGSNYEQETEETPKVQNNGINRIYRIMDKKHKIKRYKSGCIYDVILEYLVKNLPVDFLKSDVQSILGEYYKKANLKVPIDSSLNTYAGLYIRCGRESSPPVFKRIGEIGKERGRGRRNGKYRKTGEKLQIGNIKFVEFSSCKRWSKYEDKLIKDNYKKMSYRKLQEKYLPHRTLMSIEKHATSTLHLKKPYAEKIEDEPVKEKKDIENGFNIHVVDKLTQRKKADPVEPEEEKVKETELEEPIKIKSAEPNPNDESAFFVKIKRKKTEDDLVDFQSLSFPDQIYMYAGKSGWVGLKRDISFLIIKKHFPDRTIDEIKDAIQKLIVDNRVIQTGSGRVNFKGDREVIT